MSNEVKARKEPLPYNAQQRVQAVLSIWSERRRPGEVCREMSISSAVLWTWEKRALAAMLKALDSQTRLEPGPALSPKLERLLAQQADGTFAPARHREDGQTTEKAKPATPSKP